jgi:hypothetical protein
VTCQTTFGVSLIGTYLGRDYKGVPALCGASARKRLPDSGRVEAPSCCGDYRVLHSGSYAACLPPATAQL